MQLKKGTIKRIHVNQRNIRSGRTPVMTIQTSKKPIYANRVDIKGPSSLVFRPDKPLHCGARVWIETRAEVECD